MSAAGLLIVSGISLKVPAKLFGKKWASCEAQHSIPFFGIKENYSTVSKMQNPKTEVSQEEIADADLSWPKRDGREKIMSISQINANAEQEDRAVLQSIVTPYNGEPVLAAVLDGHGGWQIAEYVQKKLSGYVSREISHLSSISKKKLTNEELAECLKKSFIKLDHDIMERIKGTCDMGLSRTANMGACCVAVLITKDCVISANSGDCRAILSDGKSLVCLTQPHSANEKSEQDRLKKDHPEEDDIVVCKRSFQVEKEPVGFLDYPMKWLGYLGNEIQQTSCYVKGRLQPTRSFGDFYLKKTEFAYDYESNKPFVYNAKSFPYITVEPDIKIEERSSTSPQFVLLASDGVWDFLTPKEVAEIAADKLLMSVEDATVGVIQSVLGKASKESGLGIAQIAVMSPSAKRHIFDDATVCIVSLHHQKKE